MLVNMRVRPADAEDGMSLSVPEDCEVVVPVVGVRLGVFFLAGVLFGAGASTGENCTGRCLGRDDRRRVSRMTSSSLGVVLCVCVCEREREIERRVCDVCVCAPTCASCPSKKLGACGIRLLLTQTPCAFC